MSKPDWIGIKADGKWRGDEWIGNGRFVITAEFYQPDPHWVELCKCDTLEAAKAALPHFKSWRKELSQ